MKAKKILLIITALCCTMMSACNKQQDNTGNVSRETTASKAEEKSGEAAVIDVFSELNVTFEGENGAGKIICEYTGDNDFIKYDVEFKGDRNGRYKNGDTAIVKLDYSDYRAENANVYFKEKEKEYTVEGLWGVILSADGYDFSECNAVLKERMFDKEKVNFNTLYKISDLDVGNTLWTAYVDGKQEDASWKIISAEFEPIQGGFFVSENSSKISNNYYIFYKATLLCERIEGITNIDPNTKYALGDTKEMHYVIWEITENVFVEKDSNIVKVNPEAYSGKSEGRLVYEMSMGRIYGAMNYNKEYNNNFDEFIENFRNSNKGEFYDIEIQ